jgi:AcrR family transcriptional regulator
VTETRKAIATRGTIARVALRLAQERGPAQVTAQDIADGARVSVRTVYNHFPSAAHAILGIDPRLPERLAARLVTRPADEPPLQALSVAVIGRGVGPAEWRARAEIARANEQLYGVYLASFAANDDWLTRAMARRLGHDAADIYPRLVVTLGLAAMRVATMHAIEQAPAGCPDDELIKVIVHEIDATLATVEAGLPRPTQTRVGSGMCQKFDLFFAPTRRALPHDGSDERITQPDQRASILLTNARVAVKVLAVGGRRRSEE